MGFANPAKPINYAMIGELVTDASVDYDRVRQACDVALVSTEQAIAAARAAQVTTGQVRDAAEAALVSTDAAIEASRAAVLDAVSALSGVVNSRQPSPTVPGWSPSRITALAQLVAVQAALTAALAPDDDSSEATAARDALTARRDALWATVKTP